MQVGVIGINHFSSSLSLREKVAKVCQKAFGPKGCIHETCTVLLSTCNRTEIYFSSPNLAESHSAILQVLRQAFDENIEHALYSYFGSDCFLHLGRVISGMDSLIFGESEIQRQVKLAYESERKARKLTPSLHYLFQKGLKVGKEMRTRFLPSQERLPQTLYSLVNKGSRILFVGNSAINRGLIAYFLKRGCSRVTLCTRMKGKCPHFDVRGWETLENWTDFDVVIAGTYHDEYILKETSSLKDHKRQILLFDLGMPRNIDPELDKHSHLKLFNIDVLCQMANAQNQSGKKEIQLCETHIENVIRRQFELFQKRAQAKWRYAETCKELSSALSS